MNNNLTYKKALPEDVALIAELAESIWKKHYITIISLEQINYMLKKMYSAESIIQQMNEMHQYTLVYNSETPIGYISLSTVNSKNYILHKFYIESNEQGKGIGTKVLATILKDISNAETIELTVNRKNYKSINFYLKNGFIIKEVADFDIGEGYFMNDFIMVKMNK